MMKVLNNNSMKYISILLLLFFAIKYTYAQPIEIQDFLQSRLQNWNKPMSYSYSWEGNSSQIKMKQDKDSFNFKIIDSVLEGEIYFSNPKNVNKILFVNYPSWQVLKFPFSLNESSWNISVEVSPKISFKIPLVLKGDYTFEILDVHGFPLVHEVVSYGDEVARGEAKKNNLQEIKDDINTLRVSLWYDPLVFSDLLQNIAIKKISDMKEIWYIGHRSPYGNDIFSFASSDEKVYFKRLGENVAWGSGISLMEAYKWILNSPAHRYLLLFPAWKKIGMSFVEKDGVWYFVQVFSD